MGDISRFKTKEERIKEKLSAYDEMDAKVEQMLKNVSVESSPDDLMAAFEGIQNRRKTYNEYRKEEGKEHLPDSMDTAEELLSKALSKKEIDSGVTVCKEIEINGKKVEWPPTV